MVDVRLGTPLWHALSDAPSRFAQRFRAVLRFPSQIGPFLAVQSSADVAINDLCATTEVGEVVDSVGVLPKRSTDWQVAEPEFSSKRPVRAAQIRPPKKAKPAHLRGF